MNVVFYLTIIGILLNLAGTIWTLSHIVFRSTKNVGTVAAERGTSKQKDAKDNKAKYIVGMVFIFVGAALQIAGVIIGHH